MENLIAIAAILLSVLGIASVIAALTPTPKDDEAIGKLIALIHTLGLNFKGKGK